MAEQRRRLVRLAVLEELRASYGIKVKSGSCLAAAKAPEAAAAEVSGAGELRGLRFPGRAEPKLPRVQGLLLSREGLFRQPCRSRNAAAPASPQQGITCCNGKRSFPPLCCSVLQGALIEPCCDSGRQWLRARGAPAPGSLAGQMAKELCSSFVRGRAGR